MTPRREQGHKRVRAFLAGDPVLDTRRPVLVWEWPFYPTYWVPAGDVLATLRPAGGDRFDLVGAHAVAPAAARYDDTGELVRVDWDAMDQWFEEDEPVMVHPRDPGVRVDVLASSRHVVVQVDGTTLIDSTQPRILFETRLPPRYYVPLTAVRQDLLRPSTTTTRCPYKGTATYWSVEVDGVGHPDLVWTYPAPLAESQKIAGLVTVYTEKVDLWLDGELQDRPVTHFA